MGRIKDWLMSMESLAEEAIANNFDEEEAVQFMVDNLNNNYTALRDTLRDVYRNVKEQQDFEGGV
jgi:DNA-binding ferritin-like protein|tara:strand:+ start:1910 stop:2104 length:195 start_codon:yes stop_codon:yes gene_type:complete